jgi:phospholipid transport system substrate-binding protein
VTSKFVLLVCTLIATLLESAYAASGDPAVDQVQILTSSLLKSMQAGAAESMTHRYQRLKPVIDQVFALPLITRLSVGPEWDSFPLEQQRELIAAFSRFTVANYAYNFQNFDGQKFEIEGNVLTRGDDKVVRTALVSPHDTSVQLLYRMRQVNGTWKIVDVYYNGVSELTLRRSDFAAAVSSGGASALLAHLNKASDDLMK